MGEFFKVTHDVLIPRDETEILVRKAIEIINQNKLKNILDIGTGSGCIACTIADKTEAVVLGVDISSDALRIALDNVTRLGINNRAVFRKSDLYEKIREDEKFDMINSALKETYIGNVNRYYFRHGTGKLIGPSSKKIGTWRNGKFTGWGREIRNNGEVYEGKFNDGKLNGKGIYKYKDILYIGDFENNLRQGKGEKITKNYYYKGHFNNDQIDGYGRIQFINSNEGESEYEGFFKQNNIEGKGILRWKKGDIYEGEVKNGKMNGEGILKTYNGVIIKGLFRDGIKINTN